MNSDDTEVHTLVDGNINASTRKRSWFLTINNFTPLDVDRLNGLDCRYKIWQIEKGKECGTPHIHALIYYDNARVWPKKLFPTAHIVYPKNLQKCIKYCSKEDTRVEGPFEFGDRPQQGNRSDLDAVAKAVIDGTPLKTVAEQFPSHYVKYSRGLKLLREETQKHRDQDEGVTVLWLWGLAGVGKTYIPHQIFGEDIYIKDGTPWWDNYDHEKCILIDDFDGKWPFRDLLRLLDRYKYQGQFKGGYIKINSPFIIITCEFPPWHFWEGNELKQVTRRIREIIKIENVEDGKESVLNVLSYRM